MIASALRAQIQQVLASEPDGVANGDLARLALGVLLERDREQDPAAFLACEALCESLAARFEGRSLDRFEATLDAIDDVVPDPAHLPRLREELRHFIERVEQLSQEATRAPRRQPVLHESAA